MEENNCLYKEYCIKDNEHGKYHPCYNVPYLLDELYRKCDYKDLKEDSNESK